tara:strand:+ start:183 stop:350 length:168 start_codon:yes stop_codon:yes gene_type:complete
MAWGTSTVECFECLKVFHLHGWLPTTIQIWKQNEGLECCGVQTKLVNWRKEDESS